VQDETGETEMFPDEALSDDDDVDKALKKKVLTKKEKRDQMLKKEEEERENMAIDLLTTRKKSKHPTFSLSLSPPSSLYCSLPPSALFLSLPLSSSPTIFDTAQGCLYQEQAHQKQGIERLADGQTQSNRKEKEKRRKRGQKGSPRRPLREEWKEEGRGNGRGQTCEEGKEIKTFAASCFIIPLTAELHRPPTKPTIIKITILVLNKEIPLF
jgi:hypothetical protein